MTKLRLFWRWTVIIIWDHAKYHASRNPVKRKVATTGEEWQRAGTVANAQSTYPFKGE